MRLSSYRFLVCFAQVHYMQSSVFARSSEWIPFFSINHRADHTHVEVIQSMVPQANCWTYWRSSNPVVPFTYYFGSVTGNYLPRVGQTGWHKQSIIWSLIYFSKYHTVSTVSQTGNSVFSFCCNVFFFQSRTGYDVQIYSGYEICQTQNYTLRPMRNGSLLIRLEATLVPLGSSTWTSGTCCTSVSKSGLHTTCSEAPRSMVISFPCFEVLSRSPFTLVHRLTPTQNSLLSRLPPRPIEDLPVCSGALTYFHTPNFRAWRSHYVLFLLQWK